MKAKISSALTPGKTSFGIENKSGCMQGIIDIDMVWYAWEGED